MLTAHEQKLMEETQRVGEAILDKLPWALCEWVPKDASKEAETAGIISALLHWVLFVRRVHQCFEDQDPPDDREQFLELCNIAYDDFAGEDDSK